MWDAPARSGEPRQPSSPAAGCLGRGPSEADGFQRLGHGGGPGSRGGRDAGGVAGRGWTGAKPMTGRGDGGCSHE